MRQLEIELTQIEFGERFRKDYGNITELVTSIQKEGIIQPIAVYAQPDKEFPYLLLAGGRRYTAATKAGLTTVPSLVFDEYKDELDIRTIELAENIYRKDLEWHEKIKLEAEIHALQVAKYGKATIPGVAGTEVIGWNKKKTAEMLGVDPGKITKDLVLANLLERMPSLKDSCKSADEARKVIMKAATTIAKEDMAKAVIKNQTNTPIDIQRQQLVDRFIIGDFFEYIQSVPDKSFDIVEMDPPYAIDLMNAKKSEDGMNLQMGSYNEIPKGTYLFEMDRFIKECYRVMADDAWLLLWFGPEPWFQPLFEILRRYNLEGLRLPAIWNKVGQSGQSKRPDLYLANNYEMFFYVRKGNATIQRQGRPNNFDYKPVTSSDKEHPTEKPIELYMDILSTFALPGHRLLVPFLGSGNTLLAGENLGIKGLGYEKSKDRKDGFTLKVYNSRPGEYRSYR
jgi:DNA modification methylase